MNRELWRQLTIERAGDAQALLDSQRWAGAYYLAGYAVECALKACIVRRFEGEPGLIFSERNVVNLSWTHDFNSLINAASIRRDLETEKIRNSQFATNWLLVEKWNEASRYETREQAGVDEFFRAVFDDPDGVLTWVMDRWQVDSLRMGAGSLSG